jgi:hypothetical protein
MTKRVFSVVVFLVLMTASAVTVFAQQQPSNPRIPLKASSRAIKAFTPLNFRDTAAREAKNPPKNADEIEEIDTPQPPPPPSAFPKKHQNVALPASSGKMTSQSFTSFGTGTSPGPMKTFKAEFLSSTSIPPDTMGAVGTTHAVSVTNDRMRIQTRDGVEVSRMTLNAFWAGVTVKGGAVSTFDPKIFFDRYNNRFILISSANGTNVNSGALFAVSATADPTGTWYRWSVACDPSSTGGSGGAGRWIDYPSVGFNKNWIVVNENTFNYTCTTTSPFPCASTGFWGEQIFVLDKQAAYSNTLGTINSFESDFNTGCNSSPNPDTALGCGFTMAPAITEDNTTDTLYMVEDWVFDGQLRLSKITGTASAPVLTVGTQFPQSANAWRFDAPRISNRTTATTSGTITSSGGYLPQRQQSANLTSGTRMMANDSRVQNAVYRGGSLWCTHTVMLSATAQPAAQIIGGAGNPVDTHSGIQWWQIDPTNESGGAVSPIQNGRIEDPTADNCHNGQGGSNIIAGRCTSTATQTGEFFAFPNISVNQNNDVFIGFTRFSPLTYPNSGYVIRRSTDALNTTRDPVIFRPGQANYNIGSGTSTATYPSNPTRQNRWGDYSAAQTDPLNDTDFWTVQEYAGTVRDFGIGLAGNWETWWAQVRPTATAPTAGTLIISELRLRGPQGVRDEFVELYNPSETPVIVQTTDGSDGWALAYSTNGTTVSAVFAVVPNGTVVPGHGHFLVADNPDAAAAPTVVYGLGTAASTQARGADSDTGWSLDLADNGGVALFNTATTANFAAGTRLDSVGFSSIAAGLFKEGSGIPAVTAATPTGQMTFYRDLASGTPKDTGANETDFIFANTVVGESLGSTVTLGAAGPENLDSPLHNSSSNNLITSLFDTAVSSGDAPNRVRDTSPVTNGASGTLTFRRLILNNSGTDLSRLRFRITSLSTNPVAGGAADLRALTIASGTVSLSGGGSAAVSGTAVEAPPTQAAGGGVNATLTVGDVTNAAPFTTGTTKNVQFQFAVQSTGTFVICVAPEGLAVTATTSPLCFTGNTENSAPSILSGAAVPLASGTFVAGAAIASVNDAESAAGSLSVAATVLPTGITVTNIVNTSGNITATVAASCAAAAGANNVTLRVTDSDGASSTATLVVNVTPTPTPTITPGGPTTFCAGGSVTLTSSGASGNQWYLDGNPIGAATNQTYVASLSGSYTVIVTANGCASAASAATVVTVNPTPAAPTASNNGPYLIGMPITLSTPTVGGAAYAWTGPNGFTSSAQNPVIASAILANAGVYSVTVTVTCTSAAGTTTVLVSPRSDLNADAHSDIVLQNTNTASVAAWLMNDNTIIEGKVVANPISTQQIVATGDLDGDGKADIILKNTSTGTISEWKMNGTALVAGNIIATPNIATRVVGTYDFNHDGKADIILQNDTTGAVSLWLMNGASFTGIALGPQPATTRAVAVGHLGGDAIVFQDTTTGTVSRWLIAANAFSSSAVVATPASTDWKVVAIGDFNADGYDDLALQNASTRTVAMWLLASNGTTITTGAVVATPVAGWKVAGAGDYDGNGKSDLLLYNTSTSAVAQWQMNGTVIAAGWNISTLPGWKPLGN